MVFPGFQKETWTFDDEAGAWYYHRFYDFEPDLNFGNDDVRAEVRKIVTFWTRLGVAGFRVDAAPFIAELTRPNDDEPPVDLDLFDDLFDAVRWRRGDAVFLAEANVERDRLSEFFGAGRRFPMLFNFLLNARTFLALARADATPIAATLEALPTLHPSCQWTTFLRNHDEIDLSRLGAHEQEEVFAAFGPDPDMQLYDRGIRRRLAPMLGNDHDRVAMAYALLCSLPGTPMIRYGEEIGMGDDLSLPERNAIRTPMQWSEDENGGFSTARPKQLVRPVISEGEFGTKSVNVLAQRLDPESLLHTIESILHSRQECPELGRGQAAVVDTDNRAVHALRFEAPAGVVLVLVNLSDEACTLDLHHVSTGTVVEVLGNRLYERPDPSLTEVELDGYGYRWLRLAGPAPSHTTPR
jgi:maltose alpha-D-glucosyltransferase/alpha-amylase